MTQIMEPVSFETLFNLQNYSSLIKGLVLIIQAIYVLFAFMLTRQVKIMNANFKTSLAKTFAFFAKIHLAAAIIVFLFSLAAK